MVKPIVKDVFFLGQKSESATKGDLSVGQDLQDTLTANRDRCVGMAANMIGVKVEYLDSSWKKHRQQYSGWTAQIIQHEVDHLNGIII